MRFLVSALLAASVAAHGAELKRWPGGPTPALELEDMTGQVHRLADYNGKVVLVNFWATWCEPCRAEMPSIDGLRSAMEGKPFQVLAVNLAEPVSRIEKFIAHDAAALPAAARSRRRGGESLEGALLPASFLIGRDGRIRYVAYGELDWTSAPVRARVDELLSEGAPAQRPSSARRSAAGAKSAPALAQRMLQLPIKRGVVLRLRDELRERLHRRPPGSSRDSRGPACRRCPDMREASTGVPMRAASAITLAPPSITELTTSTWLAPSRRARVPCGRPPSQR